MLSLIRDKAARILLLLKDETREWNLSTLAREAGLSYVHLLELIKIYSEEGLLTTTRDGRQKEITLTEKGRSIATLLEQLYSYLRGEEDL